MHISTVARLLTAAVASSVHVAAKQYCARCPICATGTKRPALNGDWQRHATTDPGRIRDWWTYRPYNISISCGASGLVVIDLDVPSGVTRTRQQASAR
jgi:hypothetical protein